MIATTVSSSSSTRGAFVLLEGVDRCGKTTQCQLLLQRLLAAGIAAAAMRFPNRTTASGKIIDQYLQQKAEMDDRAIHLLFSANRWESASALAEQLQQGTTVVCDRYAYSGVAFSAAKVDAKQQPLLCLDWCQAPDKGLPAPDLVIFLTLTPEQAEARGGFGEERYEKQEMQQRVRTMFDRMKKLDDTPWHVVDASQSIDEVHTEIWNLADTARKRVQNDPIRALWETGNYEC